MFCVLSTSLTSVLLCSQTHLTTRSSLCSRQFSGKSGKGYLFHSVDNIVKSLPQDRVLTTGLHNVCDLSCAWCKAYLGWFYVSCFSLFVNYRIYLCGFVAQVRAFVETQKYKESKFLLERAHVDELRKCSD